MDSRKLSNYTQNLCEKDKKHDNLNNYKYNLRNVYCVNCGEKGHVLKDCDGPITSFGIIAFKTCKDESDCLYDTNSTLNNILSMLDIDTTDDEYQKVKFLMIQRKDTMGYIDFIRGKYDIRSGHKRESNQNINVCLNEMTRKEKNNLLTKDFDTIWKELWVNHDSKCFKNEYELAKKKYNNLNIAQLVKDSSITFLCQEFGFPKGRRNMKETNLLCAEREFLEETGYDKNCYDFIKNYPIIKEEFIGTNNIKYRHIYYLVKMKDKVPPPKIDIHNKVQTGEVGNIGWFTLRECLKLIRPYDIAKKNMIRNVSHDIENMNANYNCSKIFVASNPHEKITSIEIYNKLSKEYSTGNNYLIDTNL